MSSGTIVPPIVLIAAEADEVRSGVARALRAYGVRQIELTPQARALEAAARVVPDVVLIIADRQLTDAPALIRRFRSDVTTRHLPIVVRLDAGSRTSSDALLVAGADTVIVDTQTTATLASTLFRLSDVTPQCRALRELRRSLAAVRDRALARRGDASAMRLRTAQLSTSLETFRMTMLIADSSGRCVGANEAACGVSGYPRHELVGKLLWDVIVPGAGRDLRLAWSTFLLVGVFQGPCAVRRKDGAALPAQVYASAHVLRDLHVAALVPAAM